MSERIDQGLDGMPGGLPDDACTIVCRPHFSLRDGQIFFLDSAKPVHAPSPGACRVMEALDRPRGVADLRAELGETAGPAIAELARHGICDVVAPVGADGRRPVLVLEPHSDDAALSIGGLMWQERERIAFKLVTLASWSNYTSSFQTGRPYFRRRQVSDLRAAEGGIFMRHLGGEYAVLDLPEATMRFHDADWSERYFHDYRAASAIATNRRAGAEVLARWQDAIRLLIETERPEEIWAPLGAGAHSDHDLTRNAVLSVLMDPPIPGIRLQLYQDVPYDREFAGHTARVLAGLRARGAELEANHVRIDDVFERKIALLSVYASQFKTRVVRKGVVESARAGAESGDAPLHEHLWQVTRLPDSLDMTAFHVWAPEIEAIRARLPDWLKGADRARRLRVLALAPSGRWESDLAALRGLFPDARIDVFASPAAHPEIAAAPGEGVRVIPVAKGTRPWALLAARLALAPPAHTLFIAGDRHGQARKLARLWLGRTLVVEAMDHLIAGL